MVGVPASGLPLSFLAAAWTRNDRCARDWRVRGTFATMEDANLADPFGAVYAILSVYFNLRGEAIVGMTVGSIRRIVVPPNTPTRALGYPDGKAWRSMKPQPSSFSGERALGFVLENQAMIDKTLLFDIELIKIIE